MPIDPPRSPSRRGGTQGNPRTHRPPGQHRFRIPARQATCTVNWRHLCSGPGLVCVLMTFRSSRRGDDMSKKKILLVDDSKTVLMMEQMILSKSAYEIVTASDGRQAVEKAKERRPDIILMDVMMPNMGG